jgi:hypothetical protein
MGRTLPSATQIILNEQESFGRFRRALRRSDQLALDDLFAAARQHTAAAQYASHALPFEVFMLAMLLEEHKQVLKLRQRVAALELTGPGKSAASRQAAPSPASLSGFVDPGCGLDDFPEEEPAGA